MPRQRRKREQIKLAPSVSYKLYLYLIGYIPNNTPAEDGLFTPVNTPHIQFASTASGQGMLSGEFSTTADYVNSDPLLFTWARAAGFGNGVFSGLAIVPLPVATDPPTMTFANQGDTLVLSWPLDHTGWRLQAQTNNSTTGLSTNWVDVPNSTQTNLMPFPINPMDASRFYRLVYP